MDTSARMRTLHYAGAGRVELIEVPRPVPAPGEALVRIEASALCGSEREALLAGHPTNFGHEAAGRILEANGPLEGFAPGERVGLYAVVGCGSCPMCAIGRETMCEKEPEVRSGWHAEYAAVPIRCLRRAPADLDAGLTALATGDPLGVPVRAARRAPSGSGTSVGVVGLGPVGLAHVLLRAAQGASVIGIEPSPFRRELAERLGASRTVAPEDAEGGFDLVIECTGLPAVVESSFGLVRTGGTMLQSGECERPVALSPSATMIHREISYTGSWYYATEDFAAMIAALEAGLDLGALRTHEVPAEDAQAAVTEFLEGRTGKVVFTW
ncbi:MAG: zinc-binding dehydrogenase [Protaetiibacter sp.]